MKIIEELYYLFSICLYTVIILFIFSILFNIAIVVFAEVR